MYYVHHLKNSTSTSGKWILNGTFFSWLQSHASVLLCSWILQFRHAISKGRSLIFPIPSQKNETPANQMGSSLWSTRLAGSICHLFPVVIQQINRHIGEIIDDGFNVVGVGLLRWSTARTRPPQFHYRDSAAESPSRQGNPCIAPPNRLNPFWG